MTHLAWHGEHQTEIIGYSPLDRSGSLNLNDKEEWNGHETFFDNQCFSGLYEGSASAVDNTTFAGISLSTLNCNSLIVGGKIKARKVLKNELKNNQIVCLQDTRIVRNDVHKYKMVKNWARENVLTHPRCFHTTVEKGKAGGTMILLPEKI